MIRVVLITLFVLINTTLPAQIQQGASGVDESKLYAATKQVNQFFRRFNGEEDSKGKRLYEQNSDYHSQELRKQYLQMLFDNENNSISGNTKRKFAEQVLDRKAPQFIDFHKGGWFAEVNAIFKRGNSEENILLFFKIEPQGQGHAWVLDRVSCDRYKPIFKQDSGDSRAFIHPMSHELDFMNLHKAFRNEHAMDFTSSHYEPDFLSVFLYELDQQKISFKSVQSVNFHFFQIPGWYFQLSEFNRPGYNNGWLIADLTPISSENIPALKAYIYDQD